MARWKFLLALAFTIACRAQSTIDPKVSQIVMAACQKYHFTGGQVYKSTEQYLVVIDKELTSKNQITRISKYFFLKPGSDRLVPADPDKMSGLGVTSPTLIFHMETKDPDFKLLGGVLGKPLPPITIY